MTSMSTPRVALRELQSPDAPFVLRLVNDPDWLRFIGDRGVRTLAQAQQFIIDGPQAMFARHGHGLFLVQAVPGGEPLGLAGLIRRDGLPAPDLGFAFLPEHRGRGLALEAAGLVLRHGREVLCLQRILAVTLPDNSASIRLLERLGFRRQDSVRLRDDGDLLDLYALDA
jgi:ribosomal-protein-alanine N-acetyltransferase